MASHKDKVAGRSRFARARCRAWLVVAPVAALASSASLGQSARHIITQPARDVGLEKTVTPPLLKRISADPYATAGTDSCHAIAQSIAALTRVVGPDFTGSARDNRRNLAKIGAATMVNSLIPFRGIVREISGASAASRRKAAAIAAGVARRGFLRGVQSTRHCRH